jgi:hypothetical protein
MFSKKYDVKVWTTTEGIQGSLCRLTVAYQKEIKNRSLSAEEKQVMRNLLAAFIHNARAEPVTHGMKFHDPGFYDYLLDPDRPADDPNTSIVKKEM